MVTFEICDASSDRATLGMLAKIGCIRTAHVGLLNDANLTLAPLLAGVEVRLHEFLMHAHNDDFNVGLFHCEQQNGRTQIVAISDDRNIWGPLAGWNQSGKEYLCRYDERFAELAGYAASPFSFHVTATKLTHSDKAKVSLSSTNILGVGAPNYARGTIARRVLELLARPTLSSRSKEGGRPNSFYRLIDEAGHSHYLKRKKRSCPRNTELVYQDGSTVAMSDLVDNVMETLTELSHIESDPRYVLPLRKRVVMDTSFYLVMSAIDGFAKNNRITKSGERNGTCSLRLLAGGDMMRYMLGSGKPAVQMHRQVTNTLGAASELFEKSVHFEILVYPGVRTIGRNQYSRGSLSVVPTECICGKTYYL